MRAEMKSFAERNRLAIGTVGIVVVAAVALAALQYQRLPFFNQGTRVSAYFADAGGLRTGNTVEVSGYPVGKVSSISLDGPGVLVEFKVDTDVRLGNRTEVAIKTKGLLGSKFLDVTPRGDGRLDSPIPIERTTSPYQLPDALGDLAATISGLHTERLSEWRVAGQTFADTPAHFRNAIHGVARLAQTLDERDNQSQPAGLRGKPPRCWPTAPTDRRPGARQLAGAAAHPKRRPGPDLGEHLGGGRTTAGLHR
ncbi:virulence factor mce family protein [Mycobacterium tuberculosis CAS/NITR204]|uniref:Virulence factor mce family protein n=1 Tax=Mycobacterium tuberculosis CAS/NITR204 TaxID=1310114 RepID=R4M6Z9_MYCTX|nr:virulence factor mce family protein [Mycobacterium tuberculosis CAS/NITR204]